MLIYNQTSPYFKMYLYKKTKQSKKLIKNQFKHDYEIYKSKITQLKCSIKCHFLTDRNLNLKLTMWYVFTTYCFKSYNL